MFVINVIGEINHICVIQNVTPEMTKKKAD